VKALRTAAIAALSTSLLLTAGSPALADDAPADTTAPVIDSIGLADGGWVTTTTVLLPTVTDDTGVVTLETLVNGTHSRTFAVAGTGLRATLDLAGRPSGTQVDITLRAYDAAGNVSERTVWAATDFVRPVTGAVTPPVGTAMPSGQITITLSDMSPDIAEVARYDKVYGTPLAVRTEAPWSFDFAATPTSRTAVFRLADRAGNITWRGVSYVVDDSPPSFSDLTWTRGAVTSTVTPKGGTIGADGTLSLLVGDATPLTRLEWWIDGRLVSSGSSTLAWDDLAGTRPAATIEVRATDTLGNSSSRIFPATIDRAGPTVVTMTPASGRLVRGKYFVTDLAATDPAGVASTELLGLPWIADAETGGCAVMVGKDGAYTVTWRMVDRVGNESRVQRTVVVDNTRPVLKVVKAPKNGAKVKGTVSITATATDKNRISKVQLLINGKVVATDTKAGYAFRLDTRKYPKKFKVQLRAYDRAGNYVVSTIRTWHR
jgi:archaellum component FlaF (FlaF/FlaG flagellin family)